MISQLFKWASVVAAALLALAEVTPAQAFNVQPLALEMVAIGGHSRATLQVVNDGAKPIPVEISVRKLDIGADGKKTEAAAGDEFMIFPPQAVIPPGATQSFRVQWVGEPDIKKSQGYMIYVNQLPVKSQTGESGVQMVVNFGVIANVAPAGAQSGLKLVSAEAGSDGKKRGVAVTVENPTAMYSYFSDARLTLESGSWRKVIDSSELRQLIGYAIVQPGKTRRILVLADVPAGAGKIEASLDYKSVTAK